MGETRSSRRAVAYGSAALAAAGLVGLLAARAAAAGRFPGVRCATAKLAAATAKHRAKVRCHQHAVRTGETVDAACLAAADAKFAAAIAKADAKGGCAVTGDAATLELAVDSCVAALVDLLPAQTTTTRTPTTTTTATTLGPHGCATLLAPCGGCPACFCFGLPEIGPPGVCVVPGAGGQACGIDPPVACPAGQTCLPTSVAPVTFTCGVPCP